MFENLNISEGMEKEPELPIPTLEEQKAIVAELKRLEDAGELTPEVLEAFMTGKKTPGQES